MAGRKDVLRDRIAAALARAPLAAGMGIDVLEAVPGHVVLTMPISARLTQHQGILHGGVIATLLDTAATMAFLSSAAPGEDVSTIEFKVNFLTPISADGAGGAGEPGLLVRAEADEIHHGRRTRAAEARLFAPRRSSDAHGSERTAATGLFTALVLEK